MNTLKRNKQSIYHCKRFSENGITKFEKPIIKYLNYQPTNSTEDISSIGENYFMYLRILCTIEEAKDFNTGDRCYVYKSKPTTYDVLAKGADFVVDSIPIKTLNGAEIKLKRLSGS